MPHRFSIRSALQILVILTAGLAFFFVTGQAQAQGGEADLSVNIEVMDDINVLNSGGPYDPPPNTVYAGQELVYRVWAYNQGPDPATNVTVTVTLPGNVAFGGGPVSRYLASTFLFCDLTLTSPAHVVTCSLGDMDRYESLEFEIKTRIVYDAVAGEADGSIATNAFASIFSSGVDPNLDNNLDNADQFVQDLADLTVWKIGEAGTVSAGEQFTYTIVVENQGPSSALGLQLIDDFFADEAVTVLDITASRGEPVPTTCAFLPASPEYPNPRFECRHFAPLEPVRTGIPGVSDGRLTISVRAIANEETTITNRVRVFTGPVFNDPNGDPPRYGSDNGTPDPDLSNNVAIETTLVENTADLELSKNDSQDPTWAGDQLTYRMRFTNTGPSDAGNVVIQDNLPAEVEVVSVAASSGSCNSGTPGNPLDPATCTFPTVPPGGSRTMIVLVQVRPDAVTDPVTDEKIIHNDAWVSSDAFDPDNSNNLATEDTTVEAQADLRLASFGVGAPRAGETFHYEYTISNLGPSVSRDVTLRDFLPDEVEFLSAQVNVEGGTGGVPLACQVAAGSNALFCPLGDIPPTDGVPVIVVANVYIKSDVPDSTQINNDADVLLTDTPDPDSDNSTADTTVTVRTTADLEVDKWSEPDKVYAGEQIKYTIWVHNIGPSDAQNVTVTDTLPSEVTYEIDTDSCALADTDPGAGGQILTCKGGNLGPSDTWQFDIWARVDPVAVPGTTITNTAKVLGFTGLGDSDEDNNTATTKNLVLGKADLRINKFGKPDGEVRAGENLTYTIVVENLGPGFAHSVVITDLIQSSGSFELVSVDSDRPATCEPSSGAFSEQLQLRCALTDDLEVLAPDASGRWIVTVVVRADEAQDINNLVTVLSADFDPDMDNNQAIVQHAFTDVADLSILKTAEGQVMAAGGAVGFS